MTDLRSMKLSLVTEQQEFYIIINALDNELKVMVQQRQPLKHILTVAKVHRAYLEKIHNGVLRDSYKSTLRRVREHIYKEVDTERKALKARP